LVVRRAGVRDLTYSVGARAITEDVALSVGAFFAQPFRKGLAVDAEPVCGAPALSAELGKCPSCVSALHFAKGDHPTPEFQIRGYAPSFDLWKKILSSGLGPTRQEDRPFDGVCQLADVARPRICEEELQGADAEFVHRRSGMSLAGELEKVSKQRWNVFSVVA